MNKYSTKIILTQSYDFAFSHHFAECKNEPRFTQKAYTKSKKLHGHSVKIEISVICKDSFFSRDFMNKEVSKVLNVYNNKILNDYLTKVSCESLASFLWEQLKNCDLKKYLVSLAIQETKKNRILIKDRL